MSERDDQMKPNRSAKRADDSSQSSEEHGITQVDLNQYEFSPPGSMGWTAKEYEMLIDKLKQKKEEE